MEHDPMCALADPCEVEIPEHGFCGLGAARYCIHCSQWCICERLAKARADERAKAWARVIKLCAHTKHSASSPCVHDTCAEAARGET